MHIATKLNRSHLVTGREALILPCLGRTDIDLQAQGPQGVTVEDTFSMVHISHGQLKPKSPLMRSEPAIIAGIANATLGSHPIDWLWVIEDYSRIRNLIADTIPGFKDFNKKLLHPGVSTWVTTPPSASGKPPPARPSSPPAYCRNTW